MAVLGNDSYVWYTYQSKQAQALETAKRQDGQLLKGGLFGVREAGSSKGVYRLILNELGPRTVFSLPEPAVRALLKKSVALEGGAPRPDTRTRNLIARLERADPKAFWPVVEALRWPKHCRDSGYFEVVRQALRLCYSTQEIKRLFTTAVRHRNQLMKAVQKLEKQAGRQLFLGGDDSFYDAVAHAVSSGREDFEGFVQRPESFVRKFNRLRIESHNFESCFD